MSKLNPQKASAYVGPGVLRKGGKITPVPNGPLIKKTGKFKGSTLKAGGPVKKLQSGGGGKAKKEYVNRMNTADSLFAESDRQIKDGNYLNMISNKPDWNRPLLTIGRENLAKAKKLKNKKPLGPTRFKAGGKIKKAKSGAASTTTTKTTNPIGVKFFKEGKNFKAQVTKKVGGKNATYEGVSPNMNFAQELANDKALTRPADSLRTVRKNGGMLKRADGSYSKRGLWDNIRANKGSGKKPTKQMLQQEKKINAKSKK